ncbi:MAG: polyprenyl synthetase family protein [Pirellulales bacterium]
MTATAGATHPQQKKLRRPDSSAPLAVLYAPIQAELAAVEAILRRELTSSDPFVDELARHGCRLGGKRLRPALLLLSAKAVSGVTPDHLTLAAVVEMIHTATLVHDDVLDEATLRRHHATVNARWDNEASVLLGDYLFTHAFYLASTTESTFACRTIGRATNITCEGEMRQLAASGRLDVSEDRYLAIIEAKTAELCACACRLGAHVASAEPAVEEALADYGRSLGVAFQITDDLLDLVGTESATGKSLGTDLEKRKATLPVIHLLNHIGVDSRAAVDRILHGGNNQTADLLPWLERYGSIAYAREKGVQFAQRAVQRLEMLPPSDARDALSWLAQFVVDRGQ